MSNICQHVSYVNLVNSKMQLPSKFISNQLFVIKKIGRTMRYLVITKHFVYWGTYSTVNSKLLCTNEALLKLKKKMNITKNISKDVITNHHANWKEEPVNITEKKIIILSLKNSLQKLFILFFFNCLLTIERHKQFLCNQYT